VTGTRRTFRSLLAVSLLVAVPIAQADASGFQLREGSPDWLANAFAGTAAKAYDASTAWSNPAGMSFLNMPDGTVELDSSLNLIVPSIHFSGQNFIGSMPTTGGNGGNAGPPAVTPGLEGVWKYSNALSFGIATEVPFGLSTTYQSDFVGRYQALVSSITDVQVLLSASLKITPQLSIGGGPVVDYYHSRLTSAINIGAVSALTGDPAADLSADDVSLGYHLGVLYAPSDNLRFGIDYRSRIGVNLTGKEQIFIPPLLSQLSPAAAAVLAGANSDISAQTTVPDVLTLGAFRQISPQWAVMATLQWTDWALLQELTIVSSNGQVQRLNLGYRSSWFGSIGVNYSPAWAPGLMLQAGTGFDESPITDATRSPRLPDSGRLPVAIGFTYQLTPSLSLQGAYLHEFQIGSTSSNFSASPSAGVLVGSYATSVNVFSLGSKVRF
jgi:long-chain fatty acid transport protein